MTPQELGILYERHVFRELMANARDGHQYIHGSEVREHIFLQLYPKPVIDTRPTVSRQLASLHQRKPLLVRNGSSPLVGIDIVEVKLPDKVLVTASLDAKYT